MLTRGEEGQRGSREAQLASLLIPSAAVSLTLSFPRPAVFKWLKRGWLLGEAMGGGWEQLSGGSGRIAQPASAVYLFPPLHSHARSHHGQHELQQLHASESLFSHLHVVLECGHGGGVAVAARGSVGRESEAEKVRR